MGKYGVALIQESICDRFIAKHGRWNGADAFECAKKWNDLMTDESFLDLNKDKRYKLRLDDIRRIGDLNSAHEEMLKRQAALKMIVTIETDTQGHELHAVSADMAHAPPSKCICAINSWGSERPQWEVTENNFRHAVAFDPVITEVINGTLQEKVPDVTKAYRDMGKRYLQEYSNTAIFEVNGLKSSTSCNGVYAHEPGDTFNSKPVFEKVGGGRWMYFASSKYWTITDDRSNFPKNCGLVCSASYGLASPHSVRTWKVPDGSGSWTASGAKLAAITVNRFADAVARVKVKTALEEAKLLARSEANARRSFEVKGLVSNTDTRVAGCNGVYAHKPGLSSTLNGKPVFEKFGGGRWMYFASNKYWTITDDHPYWSWDLKKRGIVDCGSQDDPSPHNIRSWRARRRPWTAIPNVTITALSVDEYADAVARIKANATKSFEITGLVSSTKSSVAGCNGIYAHKPGDVHNGKPVFELQKCDSEKVGVGRLMYFDSNKHWTITDDRSDFPKNHGLVTSASTDHPSPHDVCTWNRHDGSKWTAIPNSKLTTLTAYEFAEACVKLVIEMVPEMVAPEWIKAQEEDESRRHREDLAKRSFEIKGLVSLYFVSNTKATVAGCNGVYAHKSGDIHNDKPVFEKVGGGRLMYFDSNKHWTITDDRSNFPKNCGLVTSASTDHPSPHDVRTWQRRDGTNWTAMPSVTFKSLTASEALERVKAIMPTMSSQMKGFGRRLAAKIRRFFRQKASS